MCRLVMIAAAAMLALPARAQDYGRGLEPYRNGDYVAARAEWRPLAEQGHAEAQYQIAYMIEYGQGVEPDDSEAAAWYRKAARQDVAAAQYKLGVMHDNGWGLTRSDDEAFKWYERAAIQGHPLAQHDLALMYATGAGVRRDHVRAYMWLSIAVASGHGYMVKHRRRIAKRMSPARIAEAGRLAAEWMATHGR